MKIEFSRQIFEKYYDIKLHENPSSGIRAAPWQGRRADSHGVADSRSSLFYERT